MHQAGFADEEDVRRWERRRFMDIISEPVPIRAQLAQCKHGDSCARTERWHINACVGECRMKQFDDALARIGR